MSFLITYPLEPKRFGRVAPSAAPKIKPEPILERIAQIVRLIVVSGEAGSLVGHF